MNEPLEYWDSLFRDLDPETMDLSRSLPASVLPGFCGRYPTFGWFDADSLSIEDEEESSEQGTALTVIEPSCNPFCGNVEFLVTGGAVFELSVYDISGRLVAEIPVADGVGVWDGSGYSGDRLPTGVYTVSSGENCEPVVVTMLNDKL